MSDKIDDDRILSTVEREAFAAAEPPPDFASRVLAGKQVDKLSRPLPVARRGTRLAIGALAIGAAVIVSLTLRIARSPSSGIDLAASGARSASTRESIALGDRGVAVAEGGADLAWRVGAGGVTEVEQRAGSVFYRVEKGGRFVVKTAAGEVEVRGTCFRVEVISMGSGKTFSLGAAVGGVVAAVAIVSVYEGRVRVVNVKGVADVAAGERVELARDRAPMAFDARASKNDARAQNFPDPPAGTVTREQLLARDESQRTEIARLRNELARMAGGEAGEGAHHGRPPALEHFLSPSQEELKTMVADCRLAWDQPPLGLTPPTLGDKRAAELGLTDSERHLMDQALAQTNQATLTQLRALYVEATGDAAGAGALDPHTLAQEIEAKSDPAVVQATYQELARERAGMSPVPAPSAAAPTIERLLRLETGLGNSFEKTLGDAIGPDRARSLRAEHDGWGAKMSSSHGCPDSK